MPLLSHEPTEFELPGLLLAGTCCFANFFENNQWSLFGECWERLMKHVDKVPNRVHSERMFGLELYPSEFCQNRRWYYGACVEVSDFVADLPSNLLCRFVPAAKYLKFSVAGNVTELAPAFRFIYDEWLPKANVKLAGTYDLEMYDEQFKGPCNPDSVTSLLLPLAAAQ